MESYTGVRVIEVRKELLAQIEQDGSLPVSFDQRYKFNQNEFVVLKDGEITQNDKWDSRITRCVGEFLLPIKAEYQLKAANVQARNKEQLMALEVLLDPVVKVIVMTGSAGTGKTLMALAAGLEHMDRKSFESLLLTRPMSWVGKHGLGYLPGDVDEKFGPYLQNYICNIEHLVSGNKKSIPDLQQQYKMEFVPLQLIRGASWANKYIIADEVQTLNYDEMVALGTRVGENSKIIIMGDLQQRDENILKEKTGIHKFINHPLSKASPFVASIELQKCERSPISRLFAQVFER